MKLKNKIPNLFSKYSKSLISFLCVAVFLTTVITFGMQSNFFSEIINGDSEKENSIVSSTENINEITKSIAEKQIIVKYKDNIKQANLSKIREKVKNTFKASNIESKKVLTNAKIEVLEVSDSSNVNAVISTLQADTNVEYVQPNYVLNAASMEDEPDFRKQWGLVNSGADVDGYIGRSNVDIGMTESSGNGPEILMGILDTGIDIYHQDLFANIYVNTSEIPDNGIDDDKNGYIDDVNGWNFFGNSSEVYTAIQNDKHGTMIAGIIGAGVNDIGIAGVAPNVKIVPLKFMDGVNGTTADAIEAITYAESLGVKIINCSFTTRENNIALKDAMENSSILFVCASGNAGNDTSEVPVYPACFGLPNVISVGAIDSSGVLTSFSNFGSLIDLAAPGTSIYTTFPHNEYKFIGGTSMSAAYVSGTAARVLSGANGNLSASDIKTRLKNNVTVCDTLTGKVNTSGRLNLNAALTNIQPDSDDYEDTSYTVQLYPEIHEVYETDGITLQARTALDEIDSSYNRTEGVNFATGSISMEFTDMEIPGYDPPFTISRLYNSKPLIWQFSFSSSAYKFYTTTNVTYYQFTLPNGNVIYCGKERDSYGNMLFYPYRNDSINFTCSLDGNNFIVNLGGFSYYYSQYNNGNTYDLTKITDSQGKVLTLTYEHNGFVGSYATKLTDYRGIEYLITRDNDITKKTIQKITNATTGNAVSYNWASDCISVTNFSGTTKYYTDGNKGKLTKITDKNDEIVKEITYYSKDREDISGYGSPVYIMAEDDINNCVSSTTNEFGQKINFEYFKETIKSWTPYTYQSSGIDYSVYAYEKYINKCVVTYKDNNAVDRQQIFDIIFDASKVWGSYEYPVVVSNRKTVTSTDELNGISTISYKSSTSIPISSTDRNGNVTQIPEYGIFDNPKKVINPDNSYKLMDYDSKGNLVFMQDENGKVILYRYTYDGQYLVKIEKIDVLNNSIWTPDTNNGGRATKDANGQPVINNPTADKCAITTYDCTTTGIRGLLTKQTSPEGVISHYTYDAYGNIATSWVVDSEINPNSAKKTVYTHYSRFLNSANNTVREVSFGTVPAANEVFLGKKVKSISPEGYTTENYYTPDNLLEKSDSYSNVNNKFTTRIVYDAEGRKIQEISPNQYIEANDDLKNHEYTNQTVGKRWTYHPSGKIETETDEGGNTTSYTFDPVSTGIASVTYPNGSMNVFEYDALGKRKKTYFKDSATAPASLISEYVLHNNFGSTITNDIVQIRKDQTSLDNSDNYTSEYNIADGSKTVKKLKKYTDNQNFDTTILVYDYRNELVKTINPDGSIVKTNYNKNGTVSSQQAANGGITHFFYDNLNRVTDKWEPIEGTAYKHTKTKYNNDTQIISEITKKTPVSLGTPIAPVTIPQNPSVTDYIIKNYTYYNNGKKNIESDNEGHKTKYTYDCDGNLTGEYVYISENPTTTTGIPTIGTEATATTYTYTNKRPEKPDKRTVYAFKKEIAGNGDESIIVPLAYTLTYDKNGNLKTETSPSYTAADGTNYPSVTITKNYDFKNRLTDTIIPDSYINSSGTETIGNITESTEYNWEDNVIEKTDGNGNITTYEYNPAGFLVKEITPVGVTAFENDLQGRKIIEVSPQNYVPNVSLKTLDRSEFEYNYLNKVKKQTDIYRPFNINTNTFDSGFTTKVSKQFEYDAVGNVTKEIGAHGYEKTYDYNFAGNLVKENDAESILRNLPYTRHVTYDTLGRTLTEKDAEDNLTEYVYNDQTHEVKKISNISTEEYDKIIYYQKFDLLGNVIKSATNSQKGTVVTTGAETTYNYGLSGQLIQENAPTDDTIAANIIKYKYAISDNLAYKSDSWGQIELWSYNNRGLEKSHTIKKDTDSSTTYTKYDKNGNVKISTDGNGVSTIYNYDALNRLTSEVVNGKTTSYTYNKNGSTLTASNWLGNTSENVYDKLNRLVLKKDQNGQIIEKLEYNDNHTQVCSSTPYFNGEEYVFVKTQWVYDKNNRLIETIDPLGNSIIKTYDDLGQLDTQSDGNDNFMQYKYDEQGRLTEVVTPADGGTASNIVYTYNKDGQKLFQRMGELNGDGNTKTYEYNSVNLLKASITPDEKAETYGYYPNGLLLEKLDKNGITTTYSYNYAGLLKDETAGTETAHFEYDSVGNAKKQQNANSLVTRIFDAENRVYSKKQDTFGTITYQYDITAGLTNGETAELSTYPNNTQVKKVFDKQGRLARVYLNGSLEVTYDYYLNGQQKSMAYANGIVTNYTYYENLLLKSMIITKPASVGSDDPGAPNVEELYNFTYEYDPAGNLIYKDEIKEQSFGYNNKNMLIWEKNGKETDLNGMTNMYEYDSNFNRIKQYSADLSLFEAEVSTTYSYDKRNRLISLNNGTAHTFQYNAEGYRTKKDNINYAYESDKPIAEYVLSSTGTPEITAFNLFGTKLICRIVGDEKYYYIYNSHGDVIALTDENGNITDTYEYDSWGNILTKTGIANNPFRYSGYMYDEETKLYYLNARYYDPLIGRFITEDTALGDPADPLSLNLYAYAHNNPLRYNDPTGHWVDIVIDGVSLGLSVFDLLKDYKNYINWVGLGLDIIDVIVPFLSGTGEAYRAAKFTGNIVEEMAESVAKHLDDEVFRLTREFAEEATEIATKEATEKAAKEAAELAAKEAADQAARIGARKAAEEATEKLARETAEKAAKEAAEQAAQEAAEKAAREAADKAAKEAADKAAKEAQEKAAREAQEKAQKEAQEKARKEAESQLKGQADNANKSKDIVDGQQKIGKDKLNKPTGSNGKYNDASYHHNNSSGNNTRGKSKSPKNGQNALDNSIPLKETTDRRIGIDNDEFVIMDKTMDGTYHGHVRTWDDLTQSMQAQLRKAGLVTKKGKIIK